MFYPKGSGDKRLPLIPLTVQGLGYWYMGDGSRQRNEARITVGKDVVLDPVIEYLNKIYMGLFRAKKYCQQWTVFINDAERFYNLVAPFIVPSLRYKIPDKYRSFCTEDFSEVLEIKDRINHDRKGRIPYKVLL